MNDSSHPAASTSPAPTDLPEDEGARPRGRRRVTAMIVGGALLFAGGAGTGAVVGTALSPAAAQTAQGGPGGMGQPPSGQLPGGTGSGQSGTQQAPSGAAPSTAPSTSSS